MSEIPRSPELTEEHRMALDAGNGVVQGASYLLIRPDVALEWFGWNPDDLRREVQTGLDDIEGGRVAEWDANEFLARMHQRHSAKTEP